MDLGPSPAFRRLVDKAMPYVYLFLIFLLLIMILSFAHAYVGDGACDESDLLKRSPDCSAAVYVLTPAGGPLESIRIYASDSNSAIIPVTLKNYDPQHDGYVCFSASGKITLFDNSGPVKSLCALVPAAGQTTLTIGISYPRTARPDTKIGELLIASSYNTRTVPVYIVSKSSFDVLSDPNIATAAAIVSFAVAVLISRSLKH